MASTDKTPEDTRTVEQLREARATTTDPAEQRDLDARIARAEQREQKDITGQ